MAADAETDTRIHAIIPDIYFGVYLPKLRQMFLKAYLMTLRKKISILNSEGGACKSSAF
jgi:hypothetical protein